MQKFVKLNKLNLGCGKDYKSGYLNVDLRQPCDFECDLSEFPWPFDTNSIEEILMLDFLEHFPYSMTSTILQQAWLVLKPGGSLIIQVPDFEHCAMAALDMHTYLCNFCGNSGKDMIIIDGVKSCAECKTPQVKIADAAIKRLYGGQDYEGNWHYNAFTKPLLEDKLKTNGFGEFEYLEKHHQTKNWNFKIKAMKQKSAW